MIRIGITGGVGNGKSEVLSYLKEHYNAYVLLADELANELKMPGNRCYQPVIDCIGYDIILPDGRIDNTKMAKAIFSDPSLLAQINAIIHPAVKEEIRKRMDEVEKQGDFAFFFLEAALLIEERYEEMLDEIWYVYAKEDVRRMRLKQSRHYSDAKIDSIINKQLSEACFRSVCKFVIDNSGTFSESKKQIDKKMEEYPC